MLDRALLAVARTRARGLHFYGHFLGIGGTYPRDGHAILGLVGEPSGIGSPVCSDVAVATLADLSLGAAIRSCLRPGERLGTVTLSIQHLAAGASGPLQAETDNVTLSQGHGSAHCTVTRGDAVIAHAQGRFAALPAPDDREWKLMPWEQEPLTHPAIPTLDELDPDEQRAVEASLRAGERAQQRGTAVSHEMLGFTWEDAGVGRSRGTLTIGPELSNRVGHVQGGALYGAAAVAAAQAVGDPSAELADGHYQFLRPGDGHTLTTEATVTRRGRTIAYVESRVIVDGRLTGHGLFSLRFPRAEV